MLNGTVDSEYLDLNFLISLGPQNLKHYIGMKILRMHNLNIQSPQSHPKLHLLDLYLILTLYIISIMMCGFRSH